MTLHSQPHRLLTATRASAPATVQSTGSDRIVFVTSGLTLLQYTFPLREKSRRGNFFCLGSQFLLAAFPHPRLSSVMGMLSPWWCLSDKPLRYAVQLVRHTEHPSTYSHPRSVGKS